MKVALVYDRVNKWGGAERMLLSLHKIFKDAPLYTSVYEPPSASWAKPLDVRTSFLQKIGIVKKSNELFPFLMPIAFESFNFDAFDFVISVTSEAAKGIITKPGTSHICICLTPTRYLWSGYETYFENPLMRFFAKPLVSYLRRWDIVASKRPDFYIAISQEVKKRIKKYYGLDSKIIYPPINIKDSGIKKSVSDYFLVVSRLSKFVAYKKVGVIIEAFNKLGYPLKIVGEGSAKKYLKQTASANIDFLGNVSDEELEGLYKNSRALIFPGVEDFGLVMAEAQFFGTPVIAYRGGGALEIVKEGETGEFFDEQKADSIISVLKNFDEKRYNSEKVKKNSDKFSFAKFEKELLDFVKESIRQSKETL